MARHDVRFSVERSFDGDAAELLEREARAQRWPEWAGPLFGRFRPAPADTEPATSEIVASDGNEVGAVRELTLGPLTLREQTEEYFPGSHHVYSMEPLWPMRDYLARVEVVPSPAGGGILRWSAVFTVPHPALGVPVRTLMRTTIDVIARLLVASARTRDRPSRRSRALTAATQRAIRPALEHTPVTPGALRTVRTMSDAVGAAVLRPLSRPVALPGGGARFGADSAAGHVLFIHGGGFLAGSDRTHGRAASVLAMLADAQVCLPRYRLAPEHPFPAAVDDVVAAYRRMVESARGGPIDVVADSAGAWLLLTAVEAAVNEGAPAPRRTVLLSPWLDLDARPPADDDPLMPDAVATTSRDLFLGELGGAVTRSAPLPPPDTETIVLIGGRDFTRHMVDGYAERVRAAGHSLSVHRWPGQMHCFQLLDGIVPEAREALRTAGDFLLHGRTGR
ncbi:alpha/beta hydrolase fold domain-containing protein [Dietzia alimentaria]|uniref:alpha/beta hydrolase fold domain-containing protein n=1 Tax=Dietzia alimentaria TaxID=665550 RepID=UPI00029A4539|nr:alpha/beta hydrolase fold domain-containing protein [Dietzia alimentaria]